METLTHGWHPFYPQGSQLPVCNSSDSLPELKMTAASTAEVEATRWLYEDERHYLRDRVCQVEGV
jgi:hypothetical protein